MAPIKEASSGDVVAVLGIDYSTKNWDVELLSHIIHVLVALISILLLLVAVYDNRVKSRFLRLMGERLEESEELFGKVFAQAPVGIAILEEGERISVVNPTFERIYERKQEELSSMEWTDLTHPDDLRENREKIMELKRDKSGSYSVDKRIVRPGGSYRWISKMVSGLDLNNGNPKSKLCIIQDIDEQKRTHEALARSEQEKAALLSHLPGMVYRCSYDDRWTILDVSAGCYDITGYSPDQIMVD
ncbi:MAG TPA: PAS domain S-box protein, partial [Bacillota bacterium]|nr:PAS domain S-box protein [Bacillota bacterium]